MKRVDRLLDSKTGPGISNNLAATVPLSWTAVVNGPLQKRRTVDAHLHLFDHQANRYEFLEHEDPMFKALIGDYSALPRRYLLDDYLKDASSVEVTGLVWHEFMSADPLCEVQFLNQDTAILALVSTGENLREWTYYAKGEEEFMTRLNFALLDKPAFPIEIHIAHDPDWEMYRDLKNRIKD